MNTTALAPSDSSVRRAARLAANRAHVGRTRQQVIADVRSEAARLVKRESMAALHRAVAAKPWLVNAGGVPIRPTLEDATPAEKKAAMDFGIGYARAFARGEAKRLGLNDKYAPGGSIAALNLETITA